MNRAALGTALAALIAADAPALATLDVSGNELGTAGLGPIVEALPLNRHLRDLKLMGNHLEPDFARRRLLPAVRANTGLRRLQGSKRRRAKTEAEELVSARPPLN